MSYIYRLDQPDQPLLWQSTQPYLQWVLRLHHATHLHYDLRFELDGVLISFVLHQPPSFNPNRSITALPVNDHDLKYLLTERRIPQGKYGAGPFLVNDHGVYAPQPLGEGSHEQAVRDGFKKGNLNFHLYGKRLQGLWRLEQSGSHWIMRKGFDEYATQKPVRWDQSSVISGRTLDEI